MGFFGRLFGDTEEDMQGILEINGQGTTEIKVGTSFSNIDWSVVSGPGIPLPASNTPDAEFVNFALTQRRSTRFPFTQNWYVTVTYMVLEPRVIEYSFN